MSADDHIAEAIRRLYSLAPDEFMSARADLSQAARDAGDPVAAKAIARLHKPTVGASIVNRRVLADPGVVDRLLDLGTLLRTAHDDLDAAALRDLSTRRRTLVAELSAEAFSLAAAPSPTAALRDEVSNTLDAAIADPEVAGRLGRLVRPERWSGFGVAPAGRVATPELTLVRGGKDGRQARTKTPSANPSTTRRLRRALDRAQDGFDRAESESRSAEAAEQDARERVRELTDELNRLQGELDAAKQDLDQSRRSAKAARSRRCAARSALDRAERQADL